MKKFLTGLLFFVLTGFFVFTIASLILPIDFSNKEESINSHSPQKSSEDKDYNEDSILLYAVGDIMLDRGVEYNIRKYGNGDYKFPFLKSANYLKKADIIFGNLESVISDKGEKIGSINSFRADPKFIEGLKYAGFNIVSTANNHSLDYGVSALEDSLKRLKSEGIEYAGAGFNEEEAFSLKIMEAKGTKIGFLAFCGIGSQLWRASENSSGIAFVSKENIEEIKKIIKEAKEKADIIIVSFHIGTEYETNQNDLQTYLYHSIIDAGADLVIGHHPHVIQPIEGYEGKWIAYSLGNFIFDQSFSKSTMEGVLLKVSIKNRGIENVDFEKFQINEYFQPELKESEENE